MREKIVMKAECKREKMTMKAESVVITYLRPPYQRYKFLLSNVKTIIMFVPKYLVCVLPSKKQEKENKEMRERKQRNTRRKERTHVKIPEQTSFIREVNRKACSFLVAILLPAPMFFFQSSAKDRQETQKIARGRPSTNTSRTHFQRTYQPPSLKTSPLTEAFVPPQSHVYLPFSISSLPLQ